LYRPGKHGGSAHTGGDLRNSCLPLSYVGADQESTMLKDISVRAHASTLEIVLKALARRSNS